MGIKSEKQTSQIGNGSPAQIQAELPTLADLIFGSNSAALIWCAKYAQFNAELEGRTSGGFKDRGSGVKVCAHTHAHAHTHA